MEFEAKNFPFTLFEKIGLTKKDVLSLPSDDLKALSTGRTTSILPISFKIDGIDLKENAKLSLYPLPDNSLGIKIHPYRQEIKNDFALNEQQLQALKSDKLVVAPRTSLNGEKETYVYQLDKEINEIKSIRINDIQIPKTILDVELSSQQKKDLLQGHNVELKNKEGEVKVIALDLINVKGFSEIINQANKFTIEPSKRSEYDIQLETVSKKFNTISEELITDKTSKPIMYNPSADVQFVHTVKVNEKSELTALGKDNKGNFYEGSLQSIEGSKSANIVWKKELEVLKPLIESNSIVIPFSYKNDQNSFYGKDLKGDYFTTNNSIIADSGKKEGWVKLDNKTIEKLDFGSKEIKNTPANDLKNTPDLPLERSNGFKR